MKEGWLHPDNVGPSAMLGSRNYFNFELPENSHWSLEDYAYGLAFEARWSGQTYSHYYKRRCFFSVAQHCIQMCDMAPEELKFPALMHESGEFVCGDMNSMLKRMCPDYKGHEKHIGKVVMERMGLKPGSYDEKALKHLDLRMMATERRDVTNWEGERWEILDGIEPFSEEELAQTTRSMGMIYPWDKGPLGDVARVWISYYRHYAPEPFAQMDMF